MRFPNGQAAAVLQGRKQHIAGGSICVPGWLRNVTVYDHSLLSAESNCSSKTACYEPIVCVPAGKVVLRKPTNLESI
jgi:hypothetical protein